MLDMDKVHQATSQYYDLVKQYNAVIADMNVFIESDRNDLPVTVRGDIEKINSYQYFFFGHHVQIRFELKYDVTKKAFFGLISCFDKEMDDFFFVCQFNESGIFTFKDGSEVPRSGAFAETLLGQMCAHFVDTLDVKKSSLAVGK